MTHPLDAALNHAATPTPLMDERQMIILGDIMRLTGLAISLNSDDTRAMQITDMIRLCRHWWEQPRWHYGEHRPAEFATLVRAAYDNQHGCFSAERELIRHIRNLITWMPDSKFYEEPSDRFDEELVLLAATAATWLTTILQQEAR